MGNSVDDEPPYISCTANINPLETGDFCDNNYTIIYLLYTNYYKNSRIS